MFSKNYECKYLQWDTQYFGVRSARVNLYKVVDKQEQEEIIRFCKDYDFVTISNFGNMKENNYWIGNRTNAFLTDINIQFTKTPTIKQKHENDKIFVMNCLPKDAQIIDIAKRAFNYSRFFADPNLPVEKAKNIYVNWTECAFDKDNKYFVIFKKESEVLGYLLFSNDGDTSIIELIAVDVRYQGQNVGRTLINAMESFIIDLGIKRIRVGTQINNISAVEFYTRVGFKYSNCISIYHLWK